MSHVEVESGIVVDEGSGKKVRFESETIAGTTVFTQPIYIADPVSGSLISVFTATTQSTLNVSLVTDINPITIGTVQTITGGTINTIQGGTITVKVPSVVSYAYNQLVGTATIKASVGTLYAVTVTGAGGLTASVGTVVIRDGASTIQVIAVPISDTRQVGFTASGISVGTLVAVAPSGTVDVTVLYQ